MSVWGKTTKKHVCRFKQFFNFVSSPWNFSSGKMVKMAKSFPGFVTYLVMEQGVKMPPGQLWYCHIVNLFNFVCFLCSTLLILSMTFDRFYSIIRPHKAASFNTVKRAKFTVACTVIISILYNIPHLYVSAHVNWECVPYATAMGKPYGEFYYWLSLVVHFALPFVCLLIMNSFIIHKLRTRTILTEDSTRVNSTKNSNHGENSKTKNSELQVFAILLLVTFAFLILTTPAYVFFLFIMFIDFSKTPKLFAGYYLFYNVAQKMQFTNHDINFFLYVISGQKFRTDFRNLFPTMKKPKIKTKGSVETVNGSFDVQ